MIEISEKALKEAELIGAYETLKLFTDAYLEAVDHNLSAENLEKLGGYQHALLALRFFCDEVVQGGFIQLIQNGYGAYIFDNPTAKAWRLMGAKKLSKLLYKAKKIYDENKFELERETTEEEFMAMYERFEKFDAIEEAYEQIEIQALKSIMNFVKENIELFATII